MIKLKVDNEYYEIYPRLTIDQWSSIMQWDIEDSIGWPFIIHHATGMDIDICREMEHAHQELIVVLVAQRLFNMVECAHKDFNTLTFGNFVDLEYGIASGIYKSYNKILKVLEVETKWGDEAQWVIQRYLTFRNWIFNEYKGLFGLDELQEIEDVEVQQSPQKVAKRWYEIIVDLADDDVLKIDEITKQPLKKVLNFMALRKERALIEAREIKQKQRQYELQRRR
jgi:hypothetical protein